MKDKDPNDQNNTPPQPQPGTPEYDKAMADRFDASNTPTTHQPQRDGFIPPMPDGGHEKFYNKDTGAYDWQSHAKEAEYVVEQRRAAKDNKPADGADADSDADGDDEANTDSGDVVNDVIKSAGLNVEDLASEIRTTGDLDDKSKEALIKAGIPETLIDEYVSLASSHLQRAQQDAVEYAGGEEGWNTMSTWASENLDESTKGVINKLLASDNWKEGIDLMKQKMAANTPTGGESNLTVPGETNAPGAVGFESKAEQTAAIQDPRYKSDSAYRQLVHNRIAATDLSRAYRG